jgi:hypothetical protein
MTALRCPSGDKATTVPPAANKMPVGKRRNPTGISTAPIGLPAPHMSAISPIPTVTMIAVPKSQTNIRADGLA